MSLTNQVELGLIKTITHNTGYSNSKLYKEYETSDMNNVTNTNIECTINLTTTLTNKKVRKRHTNTMPWSKTNNNRKNIYMKQCSNIFDGNIADNNFSMGIEQHGNDVHNHDDDDDDNNDDADVAVDDNNSKNKNKQNNNSNGSNSNNNNNNVIVLDDEADGDVETDSLASMETLSDNVAIWVDGERHWISGVDANTTCTDLICALLNYQNGQQMLNHFDQEHDPDSQNDYHGRIKEKKIFNNNCNTIGGNKTINQSMTTKEATEEKTKIERIQEQQHQHQQQHQQKFGHQITTTTSTSAITMPTISSNNNQQQATPMNTMMMRMKMARSAALASEYVIVRQHRHCEEYLDGSTKVFDILTAKAEGVFGQTRKECELILRRLAAAKATASTSTTISPQNVNNTQVASLLSTDKDSGMGSPIGSSRSARFRRRKHKSTANWLAQGNTLHPKATYRNIVALNGGFSAAAIAALSTNTDDNIANERLMRIILAQDETIHRQLSLLREKERQISKIEEEKHKARERELGKNYLLETYLKGLDDAVCKSGDEDDEEIFIDEPYQRKAEHFDKNETIEENCQQQEQQYKTIIRQKGKHNKHTSNSQHQHHHHHTVASTTQLPFDDYQKQFYTTKIHNTPTEGYESVQVTIDNDSNVDAIPTDTKIKSNNQQEIELQIFWLEKVYALNKQLQREEETLLKLQAKIRKHQVRCAYQMKNDVLEQIDELDAKLALQCADICRVENNLITTNEQLKEKLNALEILRNELQEAPTETSTTHFNIKVENLPKNNVNSTDDNNIKTKTTEFKSIDIEIDKLEMKSNPNPNPNPNPNTNTKRKPFIELSEYSRGWTTAAPNASTTMSPLAIVTNDNKESLSVEVFKKSFDVEELQKSKNFPIDIDDSSVITAVVTPIAKQNEVETFTMPSMDIQKKSSTLIYELLSKTKNETTLQSTQLLHNYQIGHSEQSKFTLPTGNDDDADEDIGVGNTTVNASNCQAVTTELVPIIVTDIMPQSLIDKNTLSTLEGTNAKIVKKPMFEVLSRNHMPATTATLTTMMATQLTQATMTSNHKNSDQNMQPLQSHHQKLIENVTLTQHNGSLAMPLLEAKNIDISRLGTLV